MIIIRFLIVFLLSCSVAGAGIGIGVTPFPGPGAIVSGGGGGGSAPTYVNSASFYSSSGSYTPGASGNVLVICGSGSSAMTATTVTTVPAITFTGMTAYGSSGNFARCYWGVTASASSHSIEFTGTPPDDPGFVIYEASGVDTSTRTDGENGAITTDSLSFNSGNITTTGPALLIGYTSDRANAYDGINWGAGWTERWEELNHVHGGATNSQAAAGTFAASGTRASASTQLTVVLALRGN